MGSNHPNWKGGRKTSHRGYTYILQPKHPFATKAGYVREHRLIAEKALGRYLTKKEIIHHIDDNPRNSIKENLYLFPNQGLHCGFHSLVNAGILNLDFLKSNLP